MMLQSQVVFVIKVQYPCLVNVAAGAAAVCLGSLTAADHR